MFEKFWPLIVLIVVGVLTLVLLIPQNGKEPAGEPGESRILTDGLEVEDLAIGKGPEAKKGDTVDVYYVGTLKSTGEEFDSTSGKPPFTFTIGQGRVIRGWEEGVPGMKVGGKRKLIIPSKLGYGASGAGDKIPPNADLVFEIELLRIHPK